jgi:hypothetical protein
VSTQYQNTPKTLRIRTKIAQQTVSAIYHNGAMVPYVIRGGKIVHAKNPIPLDECAFRLVADAEGEWFEFGFLSAHDLDGNATDGFTDPANYIRLVPQVSHDLINWTDNAFIPCPTGAVVDNLDGTFWYWCRSTWAKWQKNAILDFDLRSTRGKKSITALSLLGANISLPNFPYDVDTEMPQLQADLRAAGYTDAVASYSAAAYTVEIMRHYLQYDTNGVAFYQPERLPVTYDGETVTEVRTHDTNTLISLPSYPYALPAQAAQLQTDLVAAGQSGSVVRLFGGEWRIYLPNRTTAASNVVRNLKATFTPNDQFPRWSQEGSYQGLTADNTVTVPYSNMRNLAGVSVVDASVRQFARLKLTAGSRPGADTLTGALLNWLKKENLP